MFTLRNEKKLPKSSAELKQCENSVKDAIDLLKIIGVPIGIVRANGLTNGVQCGGNLKTDVTQHDERQKTGFGVTRKTGEDTRSNAKSDGCHERDDAAEPTNYGDKESTGNDRLVIFDITYNPNQYFSLCQESFNREKSTLKGSDEFEKCFRAPFFCGGFISDDGGCLQITDNKCPVNLNFPKGAVSGKAEITMLAVPKPNNGACSGENIFGISVKVDLGHKHNKLQVPALLFVKFARFSCKSNAKAEVNCKLLDSSGQRTTEAIPSSCGKVVVETQPIHFAVVSLRHSGSYDLVITAPGGEDDRTRPTSTPTAGNSSNTTCPSDQTKLVSSERSKVSPGGGRDEKCDVKCEKRPQNPTRDYRAGVFAREVVGAVQLRVRIWKHCDVAKQKVEEKEKQLGSVMADDDRRICVVTNVDATLTVNSPEWKFAGDNRRQQTKQILHDDILADGDTGGASCTFLVGSSVKRSLLAEMVLSNHGVESSGAVEFQILVGKPEEAANLLPKDRDVDARFRQIFIDLTPETRMKNPLKVEVHRQLCVMLDTKSCEGADIRGFANKIGIGNDTVSYFTDNVSEKSSRASLSNDVINFYFFINSHKGPREVVSDLKRLLREIGNSAAASLLDTDCVRVKSASTDSQISSSASVDTDFASDGYNEPSLERLKEVRTPDSGIVINPSTPSKTGKESIEAQE